MKRLYKTTCPHCNQEIAIPEDHLFWSLRSHLGKLGAKKRNVSHEYLRQISLKRWEKNPPRLNPRKQQILDIALKEDLDAIPRVTLAQRLGMEGDHASAYVSHYISQLRRKGLLPPRKRKTIKSLTLTVQSERAYDELKSEMERLRRAGVTIVALKIPENIQRAIMATMVDTVETSLDDLLTVADPQAPSLLLLASFHGAPVSLLPTGQGVQIVYDESACHVEPPSPNKPLVSSL